MKLLLISTVILGAVLTNANAEQARNRVFADNMKNTFDSETVKVIQDNDLRLFDQWQCRFISTTNRGITAANRILTKMLRLKKQNNIFINLAEKKNNFVKGNISGIDGLERETDYYRSFLMFDKVDNLRYIKQEYLVSQREIVRVLLDGGLIIEHSVNYEALKHEHTIYSDDFKYTSTEGPFFERGESSKLSEFHKSVSIDEEKKFLKKDKNTFVVIGYSVCPLDSVLPKGQPETK